MVKAVGRQKQKGCAGGYQQSRVLFSSFALVNQQDCFHFKLLISFFQTRDDEFVERPEDDAKTWKVWQIRGLSLRGLINNVLLNLCLSK